MTIQMKSDRNYRTQLRALSRVLRDVHRSLIDFSRDRFELVNDAITTRQQLLGLVLGDEAFAWLRPLSRLIADIDELASRGDAPTATEREDVAGRVVALTTASDDPNAFGSRYIGLLASEPRVAMHHGDLRAAIAGLVEPAWLSRTSTP